MTIGEFFNYILFTGLLAAPVVQMASIGTQISEAFAGLDRIRELLQMTTEDQEDAAKAPLGEISGEIGVAASGGRANLPASSHPSERIGFIDFGDDRVDKTVRLRCRDGA